MGEVYFMREKYESLPLSTLKELAKARGIKGVSTAKKAEVIELMLEEDEKDKEKEREITLKETKRACFYQTEHIPTTCKAP